MTINNRGLNEQRRERYASDGAYREQVKVWSRKAYLKRRENPEFVEKERIRNRIKMQEYLADPIKREIIFSKSLERAKNCRKDPKKGDLVRLKERESHKRNPYKKMLAGAKTRAKRRGVPCTLTQNTIPRIPELCPALGIPLIVGSGVVGPDSPTLDCLVPEKGYIEGNVAIISHKANTIKSNATATELRQIADWLEKQ